MNLIAQDWRRLVRFYEQVFECTPLLPERALSGKWLEAGTGIREVEIHGMHLRLPGSAREGPTLEIFQYNRQEWRPETAVNRPGLGHIAFAVDDVGVAQERVIAAGGGVIGDVVTTEIAGAGIITFAYVTDPEGNVIELQRWSPAD